MAPVACLPARLFPTWLAQALLLAPPKPIGRGRQMAIMAIFRLVLLERFHLLGEGIDLVCEDGALFAELPGCLERLFERLPQGVVLLFKQPHLFVFDGNGLPQHDRLTPQLIQFNIPVPGGILPDRLQVRPESSPSGYDLPFEEWRSFSVGDPLLNGYVVSIF